ncbi:MAG TPA: NADP oxidoreductase, partial [Gaiella sp.]|nr:NADP oxidoreductase [Gaiella sp.]
AIELVRNELVDGRAVATGETETLECGIVFRSVGYHGVALPGVPFDASSGIVPNVGGRVLDEGGTPLPGLYCAGWIKRGPSGVIGTNKKDATETVELLLEDARAGRLPEGSGDDLELLLAQRGVAHVLYAGWQAIDAHERGLGEPQGRPRVKLATWDELLSAARPGAGD